MKHASVDRAKRVSHQCRNNNQCPYCRASRTRNAARRIEAAREQESNGLAWLYEEIEDGWTNYGINRCDAQAEGGAR
jgi:hypothetical protein